MPNFFNKIGSRFSDFPKRACALRELFEETNLLFSRRDPDAEKGQTFDEPLLSTYN
jgi:8-oxo-dGTP pyrophosphatase MutT (NUDIX family)